MNRSLSLAVLATCCAGSLFADVTYNEAVKYTGGTMLDMIHRMANMPMMGKMAGGGLKNAFQDENYTIYIKGPKMARLGGRFSSIFDLDAGTITSINNEKKTYTVQTFEELRQQMERMQQRMHRDQASLDFDMKVEQTGQKRDINGQTATETLLTMTAKASGVEGHMVVKVHTWLVPPDESMREAVDYSKRLAEKFQYAFAGFSPALGGASTGINAAMKEAMKQNGYPLLTDIEVIGASSPMAAMMGGGGNSDPNAPAIQMETQNSNFANGSVDDSKFSVPAGYKQENPRR